MSALALRILTPHHHDFVLSQLGGGVYVTQSELACADSEFIDNTAGSGGAIFPSATDLSLHGINYEGNSPDSVAGAAMTYGSSCPAGMFGICTPDADGVPSCPTSDCFECPAGTASASFTFGLTSADGCTKCDEGTFSNHSGATQCDSSCPKGFYVTDSPDDSDGVGVAAGGTVS